jgi:hypothetical protein
MTIDKAHLLKPDPREERLPAWNRDLLTSLRHEVRRLQEALNATKGDHPDSNVTLQGVPSGSSIRLPRNSKIQFKSNWGGIQVHHDLNGRICIQADSSLLVRPNASNSLTVELEDSP